MRKHALCVRLLGNRLLDDHAIRPEVGKRVFTGCPPEAVEVVDRLGFDPADLDVFSGDPGAVGADARHHVDTLSKATSLPAEAEKGSKRFSVVKT